MRHPKIFFIVFLAFLLELMPGFYPTALGQKKAKQGKPVPTGFCISAEEMKIFGMVNQYRKQLNLAPVPLSKSLCYVARLHLKDLFFHPPDQGNCNFHSWSSHGPWKPFCYPADENKMNSVWDKPAELTRYPSKAYEIVYWENNPVVIDTVLSVWKTEPWFNNFLTNSGKWQETHWGALGIGIYENYACAWFGEAPDPEGPVYVCGEVPKPSISDSSIKVAPATAAKKTEIKKATAVSDTVAGKTSARSDSVSKPSIIYYIIVKTSIPKKDAEKLVEKLKANGFPGASILTKNGKLRVSVFTSADRSTALEKLREVKKTYKDAWLLKE